MLIQPPGNRADQALGSFVGRPFTKDVQKYLKPSPWFKIKDLPEGSNQPIFPPSEYDFSALVSTVEVEMSDRKADMCTISISDPKNIYANLFEPGLLVTVMGGWDTENGFGVLFEGIIHEVTPSFRTGSRSTVKLACLEDMIVMGAVEVDSPMVDEGGDEDDEDMEEADPEQGSYIDMIKAIATRNGLQCDDSDIMLVAPFPKNKPGSPSQGPKMTDLARMFSLAEECYAATWLEGDRLKFASLTKILDTFKPEFRFFFRDLGADTAPELLNHVEGLFTAANTKLVAIEAASITNGRPRKSVHVADDTGMVSSEDIKGAPTVGKEGQEIVGYRPDEVKLAALSVEDQDRLRAYVSPSNISAGRVEWDKIKEFVIAIVVTHKSESKAVLEANKAILKADERFLNQGVDMQIPVGVWALRPIQVAEVSGLGQKYSGFYYLATVTHSFSTKGYNCRVEGLRYIKK